MNPVASTSITEATKNHTVGGLLMTARLHRRVKEVVIGNLEAEIYGSSLRDSIEPWEMDPSRVRLKDIYQEDWDMAIQIAEQRRTS